MSDTTNQSLPQHRSHPRDWHDNLFVYPVISRRSGGLSIGINLNPDTACNFDCVYCQVDRSPKPRVRDVDLDRVREELTGIISLATDGRLFKFPEFCDVPESLRHVHDIAFSGDGEPTTCKVFRECVDLVASVRRDAALADTKIVLITDACYLTRPDVTSALAILDDNNGAIWAKLDAGTEAYYQQVNRPNYPLQHVIDNIAAAARVRPVVIQSLFMRLYDVPPSDDELLAYVDRLREITSVGGRIDYVQVYTIARPPAESFVTSLSSDEVDAIVERVRQGTGLWAEPFYG